VTCSPQNLYLAISHLVVKPLVYSFVLFLFPPACFVYLKHRACFCHTFRGLCGGFGEEEGGDLNNWAGVIQSAEGQKEANSAAFFFRSAFKERDSLPLSFFLHSFSK